MLPHGGRSHGSVNSLLNVSNVAGPAAPRAYGGAFYPRADACQWSGRGRPDCQGGGTAMGGPLWLLRPTNEPATAQTVFAQAAAVRPS